ncbi:MAG: sulfatase [bacterium]|nr:sulfatase [bacterium]
MQKPNIILITVDALRPDHLGFMGYSKNNTPNIDNLAREGIVFRNAFSVGPTTPYSFPAILTSTYPLDYSGPQEMKEPRVLISEVFKKQGYTTAALHSSPYLSEYFGYGQHWDFFQDIHFDNSKPAGKGKFKKIFNKFLVSVFPWLFFKMVYWRYKLKGPKKVKARAEFVNRVAKDFIYSTKSKNQPFFLWMHYMDAHTPPMCYTEKQGCSYGQLLGDAVGSAIWSYGNKGALKQFIKNNFKKYLPETLQDYDKAINYADAEIGKFLQFLKEQNIFKNSAICLASDHGDEFLEHGGMGHNIQLYNEALAVPLIIKLPGEYKNEIKTNPVSLIDLPPTLCDLAGIQAPKAFKGKSLFKGSPRKEIFHQSAFSKKENHLDIQALAECNIACQTSEWKYIINYSNKKEELYNLLKDPKEKNNLAGQNKKVLEEFRANVEKFKKENPLCF